MSQKYVKAGTEGQFEDDVMERHRSGGSLMSRSDDERYFRQVKTKPVRPYTPSINPERLWNPSMSAMEYVEEGTHGQFEDDVSERHRSGGTFSSEEVSSMTSDQFTSVMMDAGVMQRSHPESFALSGQGQQSRKLGRETWINRDYGSALENVGDVYHRMTAPPSPPNKPAGDLWTPYSSKTAQAVSHLERASIHAEYFTSSEEQREWGEGYSKAHAKLPVYTPVQQLANQSAIHLGKHQFGPSMEALGTMRQLEIDHREINAPIQHVREEGPMDRDLWEEHITFESPPQEQDPDTGEWGSRPPTEDELANPPTLPYAEWEEYPQHDTEYNRLMSQPASVEFLRSQGR
jgi:hypothetical protein